MSATAADMDSTTLSIMKVSLPFPYAACIRRQQLKHARLCAPHPARQEPVASYGRRAETSATSFDHHRPPGCGRLVYAHRDRQGSRGVCARNARPFLSLDDARKVTHLRD